MSHISRTLAPSGALGVRVLRKLRPHAKVMEAIRDGLPATGLDPAVLLYRLRNFGNLMRGAWRVRVAEMVGAPTFFGTLGIRILRRDGQIEDLGIVSCRVVTNNGVAFMVDAFDNTVEAEIMNYHGCGTGTNAEAAADSALQTESTTILTVDSTRATGTQSQPSANIYRSVGTVSFDGAGAITEHGLFSQAATGGGVLLDRSVFSAINVASGDSIQFTYSLTLTAGS